ncbi:spermidine/putrescine ABC transporter ATP-binding protein [Agreia sp. Leaf335]|uniref:ABC transporter ATP-binding protein n=1 Tax=Agreia sp. Leaf335 TaxID=1736340 RepID=UPI0006F746BA|nr:ABC transporter ATP-binding protein [Agreia sp. Leaf335]KQR22423.1 spermidine/putrescine ABC transporter ATP-binding protein [Agreia sp. Leaf335]
MSLATRSAARTDPKTRGAGATVEFRSIVKEFPGHRALDGVDLTLQPGEFVALLGPSGCGKTTALRVLAGLEDATGGSITIDGDDVSGLPANRRDIGMVFQSYSLFPHLTVLSNVEFGLRMRKVEKGERRTRALEALEMVGLGAHAERYAHQLSGGQQQRVALARALVTEPRVLLLDEPLSALDARVRVQLRDEIRRIQIDLGITTLFVTHDQEEALAVADRVAVMRAGTIEQIGAPEELYTRAKTSFVAEFVGLSNRLDGVIETPGVVTVEGVVLPLIDQAAQIGAVSAYVRPEDVVFASEGISAEVVSSSFLGSFRRSTVRLASGALVRVQHGATSPVAVGDRVFLTFTGAPVAVKAADAS